MTDVVVTVPKDLWFDWIEEGDLPGDEPTGEEWGFYTGGGSPAIEAGERVYVVAHGLLRGWSPLTRIVLQERGRIVLCRAAGARAVTIDRKIRGFRGWRYRDWLREEERPFTGWRAVVPVTAPSAKEQVNAGRRSVCKSKDRSKGQRLLFPWAGVT